MCGPHRHFAPLLPHTLRRIPQAVGIVATCFLLSTYLTVVGESFNTAGGRCCCNLIAGMDFDGDKVEFQYRKR